LSDSYYSQPRADVAALVPETAERILDVGCGFGSLGRQLNAAKARVMHGIERNPAAADHLQGVYQRYLIADGEAGLEQLHAERYDCIVFADVLEHLVDPWAVLRKAREMLTPGGAIVASIPNIRNIAVLFDLVLRGRWRYQDSGLLDRTHLRFFTRAEIHDLYAAAGLTIERIEVNRDRYRPMLRVVAALPVLLIPDLSVCQFLVRGRPTSAA
jgi:2-polyprenyl-3-methyl-5-hydroxy-6-metoxy-1,4-benzoquinol methylase